MAWSPGGGAQGFAARRVRDPRLRATARALRAAPRPRSSRGPGVLPRLVSRVSRVAGVLPGWSRAELSDRRRAHRVRSRRAPRSPLGRAARSPGFRPRAQGHAHRGRDRVRLRGRRARPRARPAPPAPSGSPALPAPVLLGGRRVVRSDRRLRQRLPAHLRRGARRVLATRHDAAARARPRRARDGVAHEAAHFLRGAGAARPRRARARVPTPTSVPRFRRSSTNRPSVRSSNRTGVPKLVLGHAETRNERRAARTREASPTERDRRRRHHTAAPGSSRSVPHAAGRVPLSPRVRAGARLLARRAGRRQRRQHLVALRAGRHARRRRPRARALQSG